MVMNIEIIDKILKMWFVSYFLFVSFNIIVN